jgi:CheY-like chemotaxis protein
MLKYGVGVENDDLIKTCNSGPEAINIIKEDLMRHNYIYSSFKLILMDQNMPEMDGNQAAILIREYLYSFKIDQPIISSVTGHSEQIFIDKAIYSGIN